MEDLLQGFSVEDRIKNARNSQIISYRCFLNVDSTASIEDIMEIRKSKGLDWKEKND